MGRTLWKGGKYMAQWLEISGDDGVYPLQDVIISNNLP